MAAQLADAPSPWRLDNGIDPGVEQGFHKLLDRYEGCSLVGWKLGANDLPMRQRWGIEHCVLGVIPSGSIHTSPHSTDISMFSCAAVEPELSFHIHKDVPGDADDHEIEKAILGVSLAAEIVDIAGRMDEPGSVVARNSSHHAFVCGNTVLSINEFDMDQTVVVASKNEELVWTVPVSLLLPEANTIVGFVARYLERFGRTLTAGSVVMSGVLTPVPVWAKASDEVKVTASQLGDVQLKFEENE
jgi:2-keto-4-pentenoate hydratase